MFLLYFLENNNNDFNYSLLVCNCLIFTVRSSYVSAVLGIVILSVCLSVTCMLCDETKEHTAAWRGNHSSFLIPTRVGGWCPLPPEICTYRNTPLKIGPRFYIWPKSMYFWKIFTMKTISIDAVFALIGIASQNAMQIDPPCDTKCHVFCTYVRYKKNRSCLTKNTQYHCGWQWIKNAIIHSSILLFSIRILLERHIFSF